MSDSRAATVPQFLSVDVELSNICANSCTMCPRDRITRLSGIMASGTFSHLLRFLDGSRSLVTFSGMGDPLNSPLLPDFIKDLRRAGHDTGVVVHPASLAGNGAMERLLAGPPDWITVSFPSTRRDVFERLCPDISLRDALIQVRRLAEHAAGRSAVRVSGLITRLNSDEQGEFLRFWKQEGICAWITGCHTRGGNLARPDLVHEETACGIGHGTCSLFLFHTFITWNGAVLACCHDLSGETMLGDMACSGSSSARNCPEFHHFSELLAVKAAMLEHRPCPSFQLCAICDEPLRNIRLPSLPATGRRRARQKFFRKLAAVSGRS